MSESLPNGVDGQLQAELSDLSNRFTEGNLRTVLTWIAPGILYVIGADVLSLPVDQQVEVVIEFVRKLGLPAIAGSIVAYAVPRCPQFAETHHPYVDTDGRAKLMSTPRLREHLGVPAAPPDVAAAAE